VHVEIDITDDDPRSAYGPGEGAMPDPSVLMDDGDILLTLGAVTLRMTYAQFDRLMDKANEWRQAVPAEDEIDINGADL
jgi:hypothetical protein